MSQSKTDSVPVNFSPPTAQNLGTNGSKVGHNNIINNNKEIKHKTNYKGRRGNGNFNQKTSHPIYEDAFNMASMLCLLEVLKASFNDMTRFHQGLKWLMN